ncbi:unnamed protein product, partial [Amoebophrya sp. A25]
VGGTRPSARSVRKPSSSMKMQLQMSKSQSSKLNMVDNSEHASDVSPASSAGFFKEAPSPNRFHGINKMAMKSVSKKMHTTTSTMKKM